MTGSMLGLNGEVSWGWLAACRECDRVHEYRPDPGRVGLMTWALPGCGSYRPRLDRYMVDALWVEHSSESEEGELCG